MDGFDGRHGEIARLIGEMLEAGVPDAEIVEWVHEGAGADAGSIPNMRPPLRRDPL